MINRSSILNVAVSLFIVIIFTNSVVYASNIDKNMEIDGVSEADFLETLEEIDNKYSELELELSEVVNEVAELEFEIKKSELKVDKLEDDIVELEAEMQETMDKLGERLRHQQRQQGLDSFIVMLASDSLTEVLQKNRVLRMVAKHDKELMERLGRDKAEVSKKRLEVTNKLIEMELKSKELDEKEKELHKKKEELDELKVEKEAELKEHRAKILEEMKRQEEELERLAREQAEAERLELEQESSILFDEVGKYDGGVEGDFRYPFDREYRVSSPFGYRIHPIRKVKKFHSGVDFAAPAGTKVRSIGSGVVVWSGTRGGYGRTVIVNHGNGVMSLYAHNSELLVGVGEEVTRGQLISRVGSTGMSTGPHLHLEVRVGGEAKNPFDWIR